MDDYQLVRFEDKGGKLKAAARQAAKAAGVKFYTWVAQAIREKLDDRKDAYILELIAALEETQWAGMFDTNGRTEGR